jgi:hypothetical protein
LHNVVESDLLGGSVRNIQNHGSHINVVFADFPDGTMRTVCVTARQDDFRSFSGKTFSHRPTDTT